MARKGYGQIFGEAWRLYTRNLKKTFVIALTLLLLIFLIDAAFLGLSESYRTITLQQQSATTQFGMDQNPFQQNTAFDESTGGLAGNLVGMVTGAQDTQPPSVDSSDSSNMDSDELDAIMKQQLNTMFGVLISLVVGLLGGLLTMFTVVSLVNYYHTERLTHVIQTLKDSTRYLSSAIGLYFLITGIAIGLNIIAAVLGNLTMSFLPLAFLVILGIIGVAAALFVYWVFGYYILVIDKTGPMEALSTSYSTVQGNWWRTFGYVLLTFIIIGIVGLVLTFPVTILLVGNFLMSGTITVQMYLFQSLYSTVLQSLILPFAVAFFYTFYLSLRDKNSE